MHSYLRPWFRKVGQLWYELFSFSTNLSPEKCREFAEEGLGTSKQFIIAMHPHGIIPFHSVLWTAYCDQYLSINGKCTKSQPLIDI